MYIILYKPMFLLLKYNISSNINYVIRIWGQDAYKTIFKMGWWQGTTS